MIDTCHIQATVREQSSWTLTEEKQNSVYSFKNPNKESVKILKNEAAEQYLEPCQISMMECFCKNTNGWGWS